MDNEKIDLSIYYASIQPSGKEFKKYPDTDIELNSLVKGEGRKKMVTVLTTPKGLIFLTDKEK